MDESEQTDNQQPDSTDEPSTGHSIKVNSVDAAKVTPEATATEAVVVDPEIPEQSPLEVESTQPQSVTDIKPTENKKALKKTLLVVAGLLILAALGAAVVWWLLQDRMVSGANGGETNTLAAQETATLGVSVAATDGAAEYARQAGEWQVLKSDGSAALSEGDMIRTGSDGRVVLTMDDGSVVRLGNSTSIKLASLMADDVRLEQSAGMVYSRLVESQRRYTVVVDEVDYQALGTAFITRKTKSDSGVQVLQSSVTVSGVDDAVSEGSQYYHENSDDKLKRKVSDINIGKLAQDKFVEWNLKQDEADTKFKDKLGVLAKVKQLQQKQADDKKNTESDSSKRTADTTKRTSDKTEKKSTDKKKSDRKMSASKTAKVKRGKMYLTYDRGKLNWSYTGKAVHGYKIVYSSSNRIPVFERDESLFVEDIKSTVLRLTKDFMPYKTYYVRVCAYTAGTEDKPCVDYSKTISITKSRHWM